MASSTSDVDTNTTNNFGQDAMDAKRGIDASEAGSNVLAQAIEDLSVRDKTSARSSPSAMNALPPISTGYGTSFNTRTTSPVTDSASPTFGFGAHTTTNSSPSTSQVSVGSVGPTLVASLLNQRHHYDLTPVMRNTSDAPPVGTRGQSHSAGQGDASHSIVSPDTVEEEAADFLHGEHLSLPADLSKAEESGPTLFPSLRKTKIPTLPMQRAKSLSAAHHLSFSELPPKAQASGPPAQPQIAEADPPAPVQFPARKFYSFTSREQYKGMTPADVDEDLSDEESLQEHPDLTPYQPSRQEFAEIEESLPPEALDSIFIARRRRSSVRETVVVEGVEGVAGNDDADEESSHKNHRLLQNPIPMTDRQWSIPSLRMAQRLATDGSLASLTDHLDDESLLYVHPGPAGDMTDEDEASLSSRASSLYMSIGGVGVHPTAGVPTDIMEARDDPLKMTERAPIWNDDVSSSFSQHRSTESSSFDGVPSFGSAPPETMTKVVVESPWNVLSGAQSSHSDENSAIAVDGDRASRRKRKQRQREEAALSWIQSLQQQSQPAVAEAASSKFLTGRTHNHAFHKTSDDATAIAAISEEAPRPS